MEKLLEELKIKIIETLNLVDISPSDIEPDQPLIGGQIGIDSIDILELVMMIEKDYSIKIDNKELGQKVFSTLRTMAAHIHENSPDLKSGA